MDESQTQNRSFLAGKLVSELQAIAEQVGAKDPKKRKKAELIDAILGIAPQPLSSHAAPPPGNGATAAIRLPTFWTSALAAVSLLIGASCFIFSKLLKPSCISSTCGMKLI